MNKLCALLLSACASSPAPVVAPSATPSATPPPNRALMAMHVNFPKVDVIASGTSTALGRDGLKVILCFELDADYPPPCVAVADYTPKVEEKKPEPTPAPAVKTDPPKKK